MDGLNQLMEMNGWALIGQNEEPYFTCYQNSYAVIAIMVCDSIGQALGGWSGCQSYINNMRSLNKSKDYYILFVIPEILSESAEFQLILDNRHVCRKLCIELRGKELLDVLPDVTLLNLRGDPQGRLEAPILGQAVLSATVMYDLTKRSAKTILENLVSDKYERGESGESKKA